MWDVLETDFGGEETANFGARKETGTALYQIDTIATVSCRDQEAAMTPLVTSSVFGELTGLAVQSNLVLQSSAMLQFDDAIEELEWSADGNTIIVGVCTGALYVIDAHSTEIIFSFNLVAENRRVNGKSFRRISFSPTGELVILTADGQLVVQAHMDVFKQEVEDLQRAIIDGIHVGDTSSEHTETHDFVIQGDYVYTLGSGPSVLCKWSYRHGSLELEDAAEGPQDTALLKGKATTDGHFLFLLDSNHHLGLWDAETMICIEHWADMEIEDVCLLEQNTSQNNSLQDMKAVVVTVATDGVCHLKVQSLPGWQTVYNLQLQAPSTLATCNTFQESIYITELCSTDKAQSTSSTVRFRCLNETDPKTRLYRILQKNKFEEAERFANLFQLDIELVHKVKANYLINQLSPWNVGNYSDDEVTSMIDQLWTCLDTIVEDLHTAETCMRAALPTFQATEAVLLYCKKRLDRWPSRGSKEPTERERYENLMAKLLEVLHRLMTFKVAYGEHAFSGERWEQFLQCNLLHESLEWMCQGQLDTAFLIWTRHQAEWNVGGRLSRDAIEQLLSMIPYTTPPTTLLGYLSTGLIPTTVREVPQALDLLVTFVIERAKNMETIDKVSWPGSAIQFGQYLYTQMQEATNVVIDDSTCMARDNANKTKLKWASVLEPLQTLLVKLRQLDDVIHKYKCHILLAQFLQETRETIAFRMLDKVVALELITPTLERQIRPYMKEHGLQPDRIFSKYIKDLLERCGQMMAFTGGEASWEAKVICIIGCISDVEHKIEGILEIMKWAPIPWSANIEALVQQGLALKHSKVAKLQHQCERVHVRKLMMKYGLKNEEVPQGQEAEGLMYYMLSVDVPGCVGDALEVMGACGVQMAPSLYQFRISQLVTANRVEESVELLRSLEPGLGVPVAQDLLTLAQVKLDSPDLPYMTQLLHRDKRQFTMAAIYFTRYLQSHTHDTLELEDLKQQERELCQIQALQLEYEKYVTTAEYRDEGYRRKTMYTFIGGFMATLKQTPNTSYMKVYRLADILQISLTDIKGQLAIQSAQNGDIHKTVEICGELLGSSPSPETAETLYDIVLALLQLGAAIDGDDVDTGTLHPLADVCYRLSSHAVAYCSPDKMCQYVEQFKACSLLLAVSQQCEAGDTTIASQWGEQREFGVDRRCEEFGELSLDVFQEDALLLNSAASLPIVSQYALLNPLLNVQGDEGEKVEGEDVDAEAGDAEAKSPLLSLCNGVIPIVQHLRQNSHQQLAFTFSIHMLNTLTQYLQQQDMGLPIETKDQQRKLERERQEVVNLEQTSQVMLKELTSTIIMKVFSSARVDERLALTCMSTRPKREATDTMMRLIKSAGTHYKKLKAVAGLGKALGQLFEEPNLVDKCELLETEAAWGYRLGKMKIPFKVALLGAQSEKAKLLPTIAQSDAADTDFVKEFCKSFGLDEDAGLLLYLDHLLVAPDESSAETNCNKSAVISRARGAIREIKNEDELRLRLRKVYYRTSAYDYEILEFLLEVLNGLNDNGDIPVEKGLKLLDYLRVYTRHAAPSEYEMEYKPGGDKKELQLLMGSLPPESKTRLPIHPLLQGDPWKIIVPELKRETISTWRLISKLLNLHSDQVCLTAVQNMVRTYTETFVSPDSGLDMSTWNWDLDQANHTLLSDASTVLKLISNCESTLACAKWMVSKLPMGSEKVLVLKDCIKLAELWHQCVPEGGKRDKAQAAYLKFLSHWKKLATAQALCLHGVGEAELLQMTDKASQLLQRLYEHPSITQKAGDAGQKKPDIHGAAEAIADINKINLATLQTSLIQKWLQTSSPGQQDSEVTMTFSLENLKFTDETPTDTIEDEEANFKRVVHIVQKGNMETNILLLLEFAFQPKECQDIVLCIRALRCLLYLCNDETLMALCSKSAEDIRSLLHIMIYLASLEKLHVHHTVDSFLACSKDGLVKGIWKNHGHEKAAVTLVSCMCLDYRLHDKQLWTNILQRLHSYTLWRQLEYVLFRLCNVPELWQIPSLPKMWYAMVTTPLGKVVSPLTSEQLDTCVHYFNLLLRCPVLKQLDLASLARLYARLDMPACSLGCLLIGFPSTDPSVQAFIQEKRREILESSTGLQSHGLLHGIAIKNCEAVYEDILMTQCFEVVIQTPHEKDFVSYCIQHKAIDNLLTFAIKHKRLQEAKALFTAFTARYMDVTMKVSKYLSGSMDDDSDEDDGDTDLSMLKAYLRMKNMIDVAEML